ncbi:metalloregulator ArsR/SmtB family transcription factor [Myxococcus sp. MISCRS1]|uniref:ArsR/SmtB family transcription factor n=1 Tax=Myxococcus TaxID=32 RepID=UPI001143F1A6|nr:MULTISPECIES: metalloregulator ArsR/SmtB family transcription factor [Myxococcus]MBZ4412896.1 metalloregulator ArsR/SmtB family transcription factor [Myxococcus sp. XM-1-1-1]MCK8501272.1 metalloregulator ArsR/SmtB family transcription factor [Myxococcus fulvus]MCY0997274.1 metalloregulator ArsR/SmtB family transcription factor [Myxococcus sp. MISCRS1]BDT32710.1 metalloregulator ArsR/SmtB family transcription factor [Myxococcus sp. MH1]
MEALSQSFRALGDPTRLRILRLVSEAPLNVTELVSLVGVAQSSVSHHLGKLKGLGLIREERQAGFSYYSLALGGEDSRWPLIRLAREAEDAAGDSARLKDLLRARADRQALNERLLEPGQSWFLWAGALASLLPPLDVADFGCGTGVLSVALGRWARHVWAIDQNAVALEQARERAAGEGLTNVSFLCEDLHRLSLKSGQLDLVVISQSLHHVEEPAAVLAEAARLLKPGGRLVVLELMPHDERWVVDRLGHRHLGFEPSQLEASLREQGFAQLTRESHARDGASPFRVFLLTGVKPS